MKKLTKKYLYSIIAFTILTPVVIVSAVVVLQDTTTQAQKVTPQPIPAYEVPVQTAGATSISETTPDYSIFKTTPDYEVEHRSIFETGVVCRNGEGTGSCNVSTDYREDGTIARKWHHTADGLVGRIEHYNADGKTLRRTAYIQRTLISIIERIDVYRIDRENGTLERIEYYNPHNPDFIKERMEEYGADGETLYRTTLYRADGTKEQSTRYEQDGTTIETKWFWNATGEWIERMHWYEADNKTLKRTVYYQRAENGRMEQATTYRIDKENGTIQERVYFNLGWSAGVDKKEIFRADGTLERTDIFDWDAELSHWQGTLKQRLHHRADGSVERIEYYIEGGETLEKIEHYNADGTEVVRTERYTLERFLPH